jgi:FecR protein/Putative Flp pilus-assembly TadE/G-like
LFHRRLPTLRDLVAPLTRWSKESVVIYLAVAFFPTLIAVGAVIDYSRASNYKTAIQAALDAAVLSGGSDGGKNWTEIARNTFKAKLSAEYDAPPRPTFVEDFSTGNYIGAVMGSWPTSVLGVINISSISVTATAAAVADHGHAFILNHDRTPPKSDIWTVSKLSGDTSLTTSTGQQTELREGAILNPGNKIRTGQSGRVLLERGHETILIASNSVIGIPTHMMPGMLTTIDQWTGSVLFAVEKRNHKHFDVETPYLAAVVKGTRFRVTVKKDDASVEVLRGRVEVNDFKSGQYVVVLPGQAATVFAKASPGLSLNGSGTLNPIRQGMPRESSLDPIVVSDQRFSVQIGAPDERQVSVLPKAKNEWGLSSSESDHHANDRQSKMGTIIVFFFIAFICGTLGAAIGGTAGYWLRRRRKQKSIIVRLARRAKS